MWDYVSLEQLLAVPIRNGLTKPSRIRGAGVRMISMGEIFSYDRIGDMPMERVPVTESELESSNIEPGDLLFARQSLVLEGAGKCSIVSVVNEPTVFESHLIRVRIDKDKTLPQFVYYYFKSNEGRGRIRGIVEQVAAAGIRGKDLIKLPVPCPPLDVQEAIVAILEQLDELALINRQANDYLAEMCEVVAGAMDADGTTTLADISTQVTTKVACEESTIESYVSTESLLPDKGGRQTASALPATGKVTVYQPGDTLVSNIRPYFKKVWYADREGTCSGDVIVFRAKEPELAPYLYSVLRSDGYFEHVMAGAKGTKMPRGDKKQMMQYPIASECGEEDLVILASMLDQISNNNRENARLSALRDTLLPKLMAGEIDLSGIELPTQPNNHLSAD